MMSSSVEAETFEELLTEMTMARYPEIIYNAEAKNHHHFSFVVITWTQRIVSNAPYFAPVASSANFSLKIHVIGKYNNGNSSDCNFNFTECGVVKRREEEICQPVSLAKSVRVKSRSEFRKTPNRTKLLNAYSNYETTKYITSQMCRYIHLL